MPAPAPCSAPPRPGDSQPAWSPIAALLAPAAPCDCQLLAVVLADEMDARAERAKRIAER